jgi:hypothetical protein
MESHWKRYPLLAVTFPCGFSITMHLVLLGESIMLKTEAIGLIAHQSLSRDPYFLWFKFKFFIPAFMSFHTWLLTYLLSTSDHYLFYLIFPLSGFLSTLLILRLCFSIKFQAMVFLPPDSHPISAFDSISDLLGHT